jgi:class 3 adenylate cyclase/tetratricopeptide (TPR) repeat protein
MNENSMTDNRETYIPEEFASKLRTARANRTMQGERRVVTILMCDVKGSTAMAEQLDPEDWAEIMNEAFNYLIKPVYRYEGTLARLMGDAILAFFGAPIAHEDDPQRAILAGLDIVKDIKPFCDEIRDEYALDFNVRVGINTGPVVVGEMGSDLAVEYTAMGDAANLASRMEATAEPGTVQISEHTYKLVSPVFEVEQIGPIEVKGKSAPVNAYRVIGRKGAPGKLRGIEGLEAPLIGRDGEFGELRQALTELRQGRGGIVNLIGEAGLGKSRLIEEMRADWNQDSPDGFLWTSSRGISYDSEKPYGVFQRLTRKMSDVDDNDPPAMVREKVGRHIETMPEELQESARSALDLFLEVGEDSDFPTPDAEAIKREIYAFNMHAWREAAGEGPSVVVLDDLHWADSASVDLLLHLIQLIDEVPILIICAFRPYRKAPGWRIKTTAETDYPHRYTEILLKPLSKDNSQELVSSLLAISELPSSVRDLILQKAEGNPFFVEEVVRTLIDREVVVRDEDGERWLATKEIEGVFIPDNLQALLTSRIDRLSGEVKSILQYASVIGRSFYYRVLQLISEMESDLEVHLNTLQRVELIREAAREPEMEYVFRHELTRDAAYKTILRRQRVKFHLEVGEAIESLFPERLEEFAPRLAYHFDQGKIKEKAQKYYTLAGDSAAKLYANAEAKRHYSRALELAQSRDASADELIYLYTSLGRVLEVSALHDDALENYEELESMAKERGDRKLELAALIPQATIYSIPTAKMHGEKGKSLSERALDLARELNDPLSEAKVLWNLMLLSYFQGETAEQALKYGEDSLKIAKAHNFREQMAYTLHDLARAYVMTGNLERAREVQDESRDIWRELGNQPMLADNLTNSGYLNFEFGNFELARERVEEASSISLAIGNLWGQSFSGTILGAILLEVGEFSKSIETMIEAEQASIEADFIGTRIIVPAVLAWTYAMLGDLDASRASIKRALKDTDQAEVFKARVLAAEAWMHFINNDIGKANQRMDEASEGLQLDNPDLFVSSLIKSFEIDIDLANEKYQIATDKAEESLAIMDQYGRQLFRTDLLLRKGKGLLAMGKREEADEAFRGAYRDAKSFGSLRSMLPILATRYHFAVEAGEGNEAASLHEEGVELIGRLKEKIEDPVLREKFLHTADVQVFMD